MAFDDLRDWIDHLRRNGELCEVTAEVDPHLEIAEITDRVTKAGGPALLFERARIPDSAPDQPVRQRAADVPRLRGRATSTSWAGASPTCSRCSRPRGSSTSCAALQQLKSIADSPPEDRLAAAPARRSCSTATRPGVAAGADLLARRRRPLHHPAGGDHPRSAHRAAQRRHVPAAGARPAARPRCTGSSTRTAAPTARGDGRADGGRGRARARPGHRLQRRARPCPSTSTS